ncbi:MAG TPA: hypothetical protein VGJ17_09015, partial [Candidatus Limnocylindrales bacterium]
TAQDLIARADAAMYRVKGVGGAAAELAGLRRGPRRARAGRQGRPAGRQLLAVGGSSDGEPEARTGSR